MIPSSPVSALSLGPLTIHFYALCILTGMGVAIWWATKRWEKRGGNGDALFDIVFVAIIAGIIGSRVWHVLTSRSRSSAPAATRSPRSTSGRAGWRSTAVSPAARSAPL